MKPDAGVSAARAALISAPWPIYNRPSIQLGALKSWLENNFENLSVDAHHFYLSIAEKTNYLLYHEISERSWLSEAVYSAILYPERQDKIARLFYREAGKNELLKKISFPTLCKEVKHFSDELIDNIDWRQYLYAGFSICLCQLTASLYFIRKIKAKAPDLPIIVGGSLVTGLNPSDLFTAFPKIDIIINGEGELPLSEVTSQFLQGNTLNDLRPVQGSFLKSCREPQHICTKQIQNLNRLPLPDYTDYFKTLGSLPGAKQFFPTLPMEISRGCWWKRKSDNGYPGCAFCNLNLQWKGYRSKSSERMIKEIDILTSRHKLLAVNLMDNLIPMKKSAEIFKSLSESPKDYHIFCEIRATTPYEDLVIMKKAGVRYVQVGIEALSSNLLAKMNKGTTAIENLQIMKHCESLGIENNANLMICFPGSDTDDVEETLTALEYASVFRPLKTVRFQLGLGSPVMNDRAHFGIRSVKNNKKFNTLFPETTTSKIQLISQSYTGDNTRQTRLWEPVIEAVNKWQDEYSLLHSGPNTQPTLSYQDGNSFIIIKRRHPDRENETHRLEGTSREIYLFCETIRTFSEIKNRFPAFSSQALFSFLSMMQKKRLIFCEDDSYLSLAFRQ